MTTVYARTATLLSVLLLATAFVFLCQSPYTKVEESFNLQAIHDLVFYGMDDLDRYDHKEFPGVVRRTFLGVLMLAVPLSALPKSLFAKFRPAIRLFASEDFAEAFEVTNLDYQFMARLLLGIANCWALIHVKNQISRACSKRSKTVGMWYAFLQFTQFHIVYYSTRPLPNFMALPLVNFALGNFINGDISRSIGILVFVGVIFRLEILAFAGVLSLVSLWKKQITLRSLVVVGFWGALLGGVLSFKTDSYFWGEQTLPEFDSFVFNLVHGKSKEWGVEPVWAYFTKYLPRLFLIPLVPLFVGPGLFSDLVNYGVGTMHSVSVSSVLFVCIMSLQPHKEWRFIIYAVPGLTMAAAGTVARLTEHHCTHWALKVGLAGMCMANYGISLLFGYVSSYNYPGGEALTSLNVRLHHEYPAGLFTPQSVHLDVTTCMTGASLFNQLKDQNHLLTYDKTENSTLLARRWHTFDYLISEVDVDAGVSADPYAENPDARPDARPDASADANGRAVAHATAEVGRVENGTRLARAASKNVGLIDGIVAAREEGCEWLKIGAFSVVRGISLPGIMHLLQTPYKTLAAGWTAVATWDRTYPRLVLQHITRQEPWIYIYEKSCGGDNGPRLDVKLM